MVYFNILFMNFFLLYMNKLKREKKIDPIQPLKLKTNLILVL